MGRAFLFKTFVFLLSIVGFLCSCTSQKVPYTTDIQNTYKFSEDKLKSVQFYTSAEIVLYTNRNNGRTEVRDGKIVLNDSRFIDKIVIEKHTPCILERKLNDSTFILTFELGVGKILCFKSIGNVYSLSASAWSDTEGLIKYSGKNYFTSHNEAFLLVEMKSINRIRQKEHLVQGVRLEN